MLTYLFFLLVTFIFWGSSLHYGFSQDDFFFLKLAHVTQWKQVFTFFSPFHQQGFPFYRPLSTQLYFYIFHSLFGLQKAPFFMHLFMIFLQAFNGYLVFRLFSSLHFSRLRSLLAGFMFSLASLHFLNLFYIAATQHLLATTFSLLALLAFQKQSSFFTLLFLFLGLLTKENTLFVIFPLIIFFFLHHSFNKHNTLLLIKKLLPVSLLFACYLTFRFFTHFTVQSTYQPVLDKRLLATFRFYLSFLFGFFEKIQDYPLANFHQFFIDTSLWGYLVVITAFLEICVLLFLIFSSLTKKTKPLFLSILLIFLPLLPYLSLPNHIFPHYLEFTLLGFLLLILTLSSDKVIVWFFGLFLINNYAGLKTNLRLHWAPLRAHLNSHYLHLFHPSSVLCSAPAIIITGDSRLVKELYYSLSAANGPQVLCNNFTLQVYYQGINKSLPKTALPVYIQ